MGKVTFEFDELKENHDIQLIVNRNKMISALYDLQRLRRSLYKDYRNDTTYLYPIKQGLDEFEKEITTDWSTNRPNEETEGIEFVRTKSLINEIDEILYDLYNLLDG